MLILPPSLRADFPVSGENVRKADKRGAGPAGRGFAFRQRRRECHIERQDTPPVKTCGFASPLWEGAKIRCISE